MEMMEVYEIENEVLDGIIGGESVITEDQAEAALRRIANIKAQHARTEMICNSVIAAYKKKIEDARSESDQKIHNIENMLQVFFDANPAKKQTKTRATVKLPSGELRKEFGTIEYERDEKVLGPWLASNGYADMTDVIIKPKWGELKKKVTLAVSDDGHVIDADTGAVIEGVTATQRPDTFKVVIE